MALKLINKQSIEALVRNLMEGYAKIDHVHAAATQAVAGFLSSQDKKKLDGVEVGANKTTVDAALSATSANPVQNKAVKGALDGKSPTTHAHDWDAITGKPATFAPAVHAHDDRYYTEAESDAKLAGKSDATHSHAWGAITGKPATFAPSEHDHGAATQGAAGFMAAADKKKLDGVAAGANAYVHPSYPAKASGFYKVTVDAAGHVSAAGAVSKSDITALGIPAQDTNTVYTHPTTSGNRHVPAGGAAGQILRWSADGTAAWGTDNNTTYASMTGATASAAGKTGLVPAPAAGASTRYLRSDGTWQVPPDSNTTYASMAGATASAAGRAGLVPAPAAGNQATFLRGDGTWASPSNTTYGLATQSANGLMSAADKKKLDNAFPVGRAIFSYVDLNPAALYGGTWTVRTDTYMFMGMKVYRRTA